MYFGGYKIKSHILEHILSVVTAVSVIFSTCIPSIAYPLIAYSEEPADVSSPSPSSESSVSESSSSESESTESTGDESESSSARGGDATVETGDAYAEADIVTDANTNVVDTEVTHNAEEDTNTEETEEVETEDAENVQTETATTTPVAQSTSHDASASSTPTVAPTTATTTATSTLPTNISVEAQSESDIANQALIEGVTGENTATSSATTTIETGNAVAGVNVLNLANTNIIDSYGFMLLMNSLGVNVGTLDLRAFIQPLKQTSGSQTGCVTGGCVGDTTVNTTSTSTIDNAVIVRSQTGGNTGGGENIDIDTGNAYAGANVVNIANTNIVDSNYLLLTLNNFGDWSGDIVFPGKDFFLNMLSGMGSSGTDLTVNNTATVDTTVVTEADTGNNTATSTAGDSTIDTGNATASTNVVNDINSTFFNTSSLYILFKVHGNWNGNVFGLPPGLSWEETPDGIAIFGTGNPSVVGSGGTSLSAQNNASINNNVGVYALTGDNNAEGGNSSITTGNAYAGTNVVNMANTNILGSNWILAIVNIFGDWNGNLAFGRPDLWIGGELEVAHPMQPVGPGSELIYKFTVVNRGDSDATDVILRNTFEIPFIEFDPETGAEVSDSGKVFAWNIGTIPSGEHKVITLRAHVKDKRKLVSGTTLIKSATRVTSYETDADNGDNEERMSIAVDNYNENLSPSSPIKRVVKEKTEAVVAGDPEFEINKTANVTEVTPGSSVDYQVVVFNDGGISPDTVVVDTLTNAAGETISEQAWQLDAMYEQEEITISYSSLFNEDTEPGIYTNHAKIMGRLDSGEIVEAETSYDVEVLGGPVVEEIVPVAPVVEAIQPPVIPQTIKEVEEPETYGMTLIPPMCTAAGCVDPREHREPRDKNSLMLASAFGSGFDFDGDGRPVKLFLLAAIMFAVSRRKEDGHTPSMSIIF